MNDNDTSKPSASDWKRVDALTDESIDLSDVPALPASFFERARMARPRRTSTVTMQVDADVIDWFQAHGETWQSEVNAALRIYVEAQREAESRRARDSAA